MNIGVITPSSNSGCTLASIIAASSVALAQNEKVLLVDTGSGNDTAKYLDIDDSSRNFGQIIKLLESGVISSEEVEDYSVHVLDNLRYLNVCSASAAEEAKEATTLKLLKVFPAEYKIIDIQDGFASEFTRNILDICDVVVSVCSTYDHTYDVLNSWRGHDLWPRGKREMLIVNNYDPEVAPVKYFSNLAKYPDNCTCKIHYNPYIVKTCNKGQLISLVKAAEQLDPRVIELSNDFREIAQYITSVNLRPMKWGQGGK